MKRIFFMLRMEEEVGSDSGFLNIWCVNSWKSKRFDEK